MPSNARIFIVSALIGPGVFALLFCLNAAIQIYFFDARLDRPAHEYVTMLTSQEVFLFIFAFAASLSAFIAFGIWLIVSAMVLQRAGVRRRNLTIAGLIFVPVMTFISCKLFGRFELYNEGDIPPPLVFGAAMYWEFPLRGFLVIALPNVVAVAICCWLLMRAPVEEMRT